MDKEAGVIKQAHAELEQAIEAHKQAVEASAAEREQKLQALAAQLVKVQGKMAEVAAMSSRKAKLATRAVDEQLAARQHTRKRRNDRAARAPVPLRMGGDEVPRGEKKWMVQKEYYASSVPVVKAAVHTAKAAAPVSAAQPPAGVHH